ncbi:hypothetical protein NQ317_018031 [Molorchus minor]|uniref:Uncharacterized protein n=1 Tax=Molorchus minor TaxID=1323400 RepID=A0ABQ9JSS8_9CUCU|nr:hypothetical protein NQ317_018031 [Molorchus minor]
MEDVVHSFKLMLLGRTDPPPLITSCNGTTPIDLPKETIFKMCLKNGEVEIKFPLKSRKKISLDNNRKHNGLDSNKNQCNLLVVPVERFSSNVFEYSAMFPAASRHFSIAAESARRVVRSCSRDVRGDRAVLGTELALSLHCPLLKHLSVPESVLKVGWWRYLQNEPFLQRDC